MRLFKVRGEGAQPSSITPSTTALSENNNNHLVETHASFKCYLITPNVPCN